MKELIKVQEQNGSNVVSARELHTFLEVKDYFTQWINRMFEYGFTESVDYEAVQFFVKASNGIGGTNKTDYALTLDTAKEISMLQRSEKGKQARRYFIECEKKLKNNVLDFSDANAILQLAQNFAEEQQKRKQLEQQTLLQSAELKKQAPKVEYCDKVLQSKTTLNTNQIAKELGTSATMLNRRLKDLKVHYKQNGQWLLYSKYQGKGYTKSKTHYYVDSEDKQQSSLRTVWTEKGRLFIHSLIKEKVLS